MKSLKNILFTFIYLYIIFNLVLPYNLKIMKLPISSDLILLIIILIYLTIVLKDIKKFLLNVKDFLHDYLGIALIFLLCIMLVSVIYATEKKLALSESFRFFTYIIIYFVIKYEADDDKYKKNIIYSFIIALAIADIFGVIQQITGIGLEHKYFVDPIANTGERISITFGNPNSFAAFLIIGIFPVIMLMLSEKKKLKKFLYGILLISMLFNIYFTASRNAWLAVVLGCIILSVVYNWKFIFGIFALGVLAKLIPQVNSRLADITNSYFNESRVKLWEIALKMIKDHPLLGVGNGNFVSLYDSYVKKYPQFAYADYSRFPSHNSYLKICSELGITGGIAFLVVLSSIVYKVKKVTAKVKDIFYNSFYTGFFVSVLVFMFMNFFDNLFFVPKVAVYFWIFVAMADSLLINSHLKN